MFSIFEKFAKREPNGSPLLTKYLAFGNSYFFFINRYLYFTDQKNYGSNHIAHNFQLTWINAFAPWGTTYRKFNFEFFFCMTFTGTWVSKIVWKIIDVKSTNTNIIFVPWFYTNPSIFEVHRWWCNYFMGNITKIMRKNTSLSKIGIIWRRYILDD